MARKNRVKGKNDTAPESTRPPKSPLVSYFIIFVFGFLAGVVFTVFKGDSPETTQIPTTTSTTSEAQTTNSETERAITNLEAEVTANPQNFETWIRLGHLYYDTNQPAKAIKAYTKSLEMHSGDANLLTDLGVMYRRTKQPEKAIETFDLAIKKAPNHQQSRFNKGIVQMYDLHQHEEAIATWEGLLKVNPQAQTANGQPMGQFIEQIKAEIRQEQSKKQ